MTRTTAAAERAECAQISGLHNASPLWRLEKVEMHVLRCRHRALLCLTGCRKRRYMTHLAIPVHAQPYSAHV